MNHVSARQHWRHYSSQWRSRACCAQENRHATLQFPICCWWLIVCVCVCVFNVFFLYDLPFFSASPGSFDLFSASNGTSREDLSEFDSLRTLAATGECDPRAACRLSCLLRHVTVSWPFPQWRAIYVGWRLPHLLSCGKSVAGPLVNHSFCHAFPTSPLLSSLLLSRLLLICTYPSSHPVPHLPPSMPASCFLWLFIMCGCVSQSTGSLTAWLD